MLKQIFQQFNRTSIRNFATSKQSNFKVTVCGASGGIGQPMSLLLKMNPLVSELALYDLVNTPGVAADLSHIDTQSKVFGYMKPEKLCEAVRGAHVVIIPAGVPRKPGMTRDDLFNVNGCVIRDVMKAIASECPKACIAVITNPVNSCVPIAAEVLKKYDCYDPRRLFGVSSLDLVRARTFLGEAMCIDPKSVSVPVIGGHSGVTILPIISQCKPCFNGDQKTIEKLTERIREAGTEVVKAKAGAGSATLSMAYAGANFANSLLRGLNGECDVIDCAYVESDVTEAPFFATPIVLGTDGIEKNLGLPPMNDYEKKLFDEAIPIIKKNIALGVDFAKQN